jgi:hypothetical protein
MAAWVSDSGPCCASAIRIPRSAFCSRSSPAPPVLLLGAGVGRDAAAGRTCAGCRTWTTGRASAAAPRTASATNFAAVSIFSAACCRPSSSPGANTGTSIGGTGAADAGIACLAATRARSSSKILRRSAAGSSAFALASTLASAPRSCSRSTGASVRATCRLPSSGVALASNVVFLAICTRSKHPSH